MLSKVDATNYNTQWVNIVGGGGSQGSTGSQGNTGSQGVQGSTGFQGSQGSQGSTGSSGSQGSQGSTGPAGTNGVTQIVAGSNITISPTNGLGAVTISAAGGGSGGSSNISGPYIIKITTATATTVGNLVSGVDPTGTALVTSGTTDATKWVVTFPNTTTMQIVYPNSIAGTFTNFRRMTAINASTPYNYYTSNFAAGATTAAYCQYNPGSYTIVFGTISAGQYGYTASSTPIYFMFDLLSTPALP